MVQKLNELGWGLSVLSAGFAIGSLFTPVGWVSRGLSIISDVTDGVAMYTGGAPLGAVVKKTGAKMILSAAAGPLAKQAT